jgi:TonB family protein
VVESLDAARIFQGITKLAGIFISYRRSDSQGEAGRLFDDLVKHFGEDTVFMDVAAIEAGRDFRRAIEEAVAKCGVLLVMIGPEWVDAKDEHGTRRLNDSSDFVRIETASALKRDIAVIPVLIRGAKMPSADQLPEDLKELVYRNCIELTHTRWRSDIQLLLDSLRRLLGDTGPAREYRSSKQADKAPECFDPSLLERLSRELAVYIGPIAGIVVKRAVPYCSSVEELYKKVADEIDSQEERDKFLHERTAAKVTSAHSVTRFDAPSNDARKNSEPSAIAHADVFSGKAVPSVYVSSDRSKNFVRKGTVAGLVLALVAVGVWFVWRKTIHSPETVPGVGQETPAAAVGSEDRKARREDAHPMPNKVPAPSAAQTNKEDHTGTSKRVRLSEEESKSLLISVVTPSYPPLAQQTNVQGTVVLDAKVNKEGVVETAKVISGHPLLIESALAAAKQMRYRPYIQNGEPVDVSTQITVQFTLKH